MDADKDGQDVAQTKEEELKRPVFRSPEAERPPSNRDPSPPYEYAGVTMEVFQSEAQLSQIRALMDRDLSEPYSIFTYRYFICNWPQFCWIAWAPVNDEYPAPIYDGLVDPETNRQIVGAIVCKLEIRRDGMRRGYIAMLAVAKPFRKRKIGSELVLRVIEEMHLEGCDEVVLETEITNTSALSLYENLGFFRDKRLLRYYLGGQDAFRLKMPLHPTVEPTSELPPVTGESTATSSSSSSSSSSDTPVAV